ncbi:hypothetical protein BH11ARM1_BH11ARM1_00350 [soil metagenome]
MTVDWLIGNWIGNVWGGEMEEHWSAPRSEVMLGYNSLIRADALASKEFMILDLNSPLPTLTNLVVRGEVKSVEYSLVSVGENFFAAENLAHERLSKITYRRERDHLTITLQGRDFDEKLILQRV